MRWMPMAWLITLLLFYAVCKTVLDAKDHASLTKTKRRHATTHKVDLFLSQMYVLAWYYYIPLEKQAMEKWVDQHRNYTVSDFAPTNQEINQISGDLIGKPVYQIAVGQALGHLKQSGEPVYSRNGDASASDHHKGWTASGTHFQEDNGLTMRDILSQIPALSDPYQWSYAALAKANGYASYVPNQDDPHATTYERPYYDGNTWRFTVEPRL